VCEHCGQEEQGYGYDDKYFHEQVIPKRKCGKCGKTASDNYVPKTPKYEDSMVI